MLGLPKMLKLHTPMHKPPQSLWDYPPLRKHGVLSKARPVMMFKRRCLVSERGVTVLGQEEGEELPQGVLKAIPRQY